MVGVSLSRYKILEELGRGGMSTVYAAQDTELKRLVALKVLHSQLALRPDIMERFKREARAVARLHHDNILEIYDFSAQGPEGTFIVTEMIDGKDLAQLLSEHVFKIPELGVLIVAEVANGLDHAHVHDIVHRDIKPQNVMIRRDGVVKLTDFGIARILDEGQMTMTGTVLGSPAHMCPELIQGKEVDSRGDIFSLGILLYQCITGELPFKGNNPSILFKKIMELDYPPPESINPAVGRKLSFIVSKCLRISPKSRFQSAAELRDRLLDVTGELGFEEPRREIKLVLENPEKRELELLPHVVSRLKKNAESYRRANKSPLALDCLERALALAPDDDESRTLLEKISRSNRLKRYWKIASVLAAAATFLVLIVIYAPGFFVNNGAMEKNPGQGESSKEQPENAFHERTNSAARKQGTAIGNRKPGSIDVDLKATKHDLNSKSAEKQVARLKSKFAKAPGRKYVSRPKPMIKRPVHIFHSNDFKAKRIILAQFWADVYLDGEKKGRTPPPIPLDLSPGIHEIKLVNAFCDPTVIKLDIEKPGVERLPVHLHCPARIILKAPPGALVFVDQKLRGSTPLKTPLELDWPEPAFEKKVTLRITKRAHKPFEKKLLLKRGDTRKIQAELPLEKK
ncbi:MAG: protein kinase [Deltaproteobacteria bacterium]|nr:protein kinase [Deltaproteobacteria bacterium]